MSDPRRRPLVSNRRPVKFRIDDDEHVVGIGKGLVSQTEEGEPDPQPAVGLWAMIDEGKRVRFGHGCESVAHPWAFLQQDQ